ncbi:MULTISPECIES: ABC transporter ATP-binding protein [unclassified Chelatococcus]|uniref:dipeptide ABC transporter ATP-binding protein n=1 Tax=unclassified Chelatococcus TaxID=2638111 RepID=UPI001BCEAB06|nr:MULTISPECIES: ABC transporter ATP-binding protein [unclassified Chelatococcus]MBS7699709.1 ABC transporter ATP-binding protein [Chelatococcus sp. YT9]MBX3557093.1 ABC transporter ATP-binding protein [Chelatococcus sp.]
MAAPLVNISDLNVSFHNHGKETKIIHGIDLTVGRNEILGIIGESGSGKTITGLSLLRLLPRNARVEAKELSFDGIALPGLTEYQFGVLRGIRMAMIFQDPVASFNPSKRIGWHFHHIIARAAAHGPDRPHAGLAVGNTREKAIALMHSVGIKRAEAAIELYPFQLSGGMLQRALIALVLALEPDLIIADEPTTNLDKIVEQQILELFRDIRQRLSAGMIFVTHDLAVAATLCDRIAVMRFGELVEIGPTRQIFEAPQHEYTRLLIDTAQELARGGDNGRLTTRIGTDKSAAVVTRRDDARHSGSPLISVRHLAVTFPGRGSHPAFKALDDISFDVAPGEILGLVGESGSGKTTLGRTILRLYTPSAGQIIYRGRDITRLSETQLRPMRRDLQMIFQDPAGSFNPRKTMRASLIDALTVAKACPRPQMPARVDALLHRVGLTEAHAERYPHELSGGQLQRVAIARAICLSPTLIVADEAVSKLDVSVRAGVLNLFKDIQAETGMAMIFITHDLEVARYMCDRIAVLYHGRMLEYGTTDEIFGNPRHDYTRSLLATMDHGVFGKPEIRQASQAS